LILDSSAIVAVIRDEPDRKRLVEAIANAAELGVGTPTLTEASIVLVRRYGPAGRATLARFLEENEVIAIPFGHRHWSIAAAAYIRYGKGRHPAALNYGDCMTYATAQVAAAPLLFSGDDFAQTDIAAAI
jgi:ribonuclease VapC